MNLMKCEICNREFRDLGAHIAHKHKDYTMQEYYNKFINYQSIPELEFIKKCQNEDIFIRDGDIVKYNHEGKEHNYFIDFKILEDGVWRLIQIKSNHPWFRKERSNGKLKKKVLAAQRFSKLNNYLPYRIIMV